MTPEEKKENEELLEMFGSQGWKHFIKKVDAIIEPLEDIRNARTPEDMWQRKGELRNLDWIKNFPQLVRMVMEDDL